MGDLKSLESDAETCPELVEMADESAQKESEFEHLKKVMAENFHTVNERIAFLEKKGAAILSSRASSKAGSCKDVLPPYKPLTPLHQQVL